MELAFLATKTQRHKVALSRIFVNYLCLSAFVAKNIRYIINKENGREDTVVRVFALLRRITAF